MPVADRATAKGVLEDFELRIRTILEGAWEDWREMPRKAVISPRSRASLVFDFIKQRAITEFEGDANIRVIPRGQTVHFLFRDRLLIRFKKANSKGIGSNIETQAVIEFIDPQLRLIDLPEIYHAEVCYHLDKLATRMAALTVNGRQGYRRLWSYEIERPASSVVAFVPPTALDGPEPPQVRIRKPSDKPDTGEK